MNFGQKKNRSAWAERFMVCSGLSESWPVSVPVIVPVPVVIPVIPSVIFLLPDADITKTVNSDHDILAAGLEE